MSQLFMDKQLAIVILVDRKTVKRVYYVEKGEF